MDARVKPAHDEFLFPGAMQHAASSRRDASLNRDRNERKSVIAGLDPAIHPASKNLAKKKMDARVKPAHDGRGCLVRSRLCAAA